ncbi:tyrosine-type recombinase/integrase [Paenibacillus sp. NPDC058177]|uniref:tyrosine-type recombinase/integrase n=1 Tax=Paenibacillus sp. NPDC058177 TaxID=3346369 RepID=UPI0036DDD021
MNTVQPIRDPVIIEKIKRDLRYNSERNYLFFCMGIYSGLRVSDLRMLQVVAVRNKTHITLIERKTENTRKRSKKKKFIIHPEIAEDLSKYIEGMDDYDYLFPSRQKKTKTGERDQPIDRSTAYKMLNKAIGRYGLKEVGTHTLRKTWGYHLIMTAPPERWAYTLALLMDMFNHSDQSYTLRYLGLTQDAMDEAIVRMSYPKY